MFKSETKIRVRYAETDQMGYCYYGNYAQYFEVARVEALRSLGVTYKTMEENGIWLPVVDFSIKYLQPAYYDEELTILTNVVKEPTIRIFFTYETYNEKKEKINFGETSLVFLDKKLKKPVLVGLHIKKNNKLPSGETIKSHHIRRIRPGFGLSPRFLSKVIGKRLKKDVLKGERVTAELVGLNVDQDNQNT